jgi:hypothetical protein
MNFLFILFSLFLSELKNENVNMKIFHIFLSVKHVF